MRVNSGMSFALAEPLAVMQCRAGRIRPQRDVISTLHARCHFYLAPTPRAGCDTIGLAVRIAPGPNGRLGSTAVHPLSRGNRQQWVDCGPSPCRTNQFADPTPQVIADRGPS
jgi:hypothetical protein